MKKKFLTPKEASILLGKSEITMKRYIKNRYTTALANKEQDVLEMITRKKAPKGYFWSIEESFLRTEFNLADDKTTEDRTIETLVEQLRVKDEQIKSLLERQRESNILLKNFQEKSALLEDGQQKKQGFWKNLFGRN